MISRIPGTPANGEREQSIAQSGLRLPMSGNLGVAWAPNVQQNIFSTCNYDYWDPTRMEQIFSTRDRCGMMSCSNVLSLRRKALHAPSEGSVSGFGVELLNNHTSPLLQGRMCFQHSIFMGLECHRSHYTGVNKTWNAKHSKITC